MAAETRGARESSLWSGPEGAIALFALNGVVILAFWWLSSGFEIARSWSDMWNGLGRVTGLLGTYCVLWQLLLMARSPWLERAFGLERMTGLHRLNGYAAIGLLVAHGLFQTLGYQLGDGKSVAGQLADFVANYPGLLPAIVSLVLFILIVVVSVTIARRQLAYETWYYIHLYSYLAVALAFTHQFATGVDFAGNPVFVFYWCLIYVFVFGLLILDRVVQPLVTFERHRFRVYSVQKEARGVFSIYISGRRLREFTAASGQFAMWRFLDGKRWWQSHPFSISAVPDGRFLRITVKNIGDFTSTIHNVKVGTWVLVEGPFGKFVERPAQRKVLLIAGGIGITPIRPLAEEMAADGFGVHVLYRAHGAADVVFKSEMDWLAEAHGVRVDYLLSEEAGRKRDRKEWFRPAALKRMVPDIAERVVYVCGPQSMTAAVQAGLHNVGVPPNQIRTEVFRLP